MRAAWILLVAACGHPATAPAPKNTETNAAPPAAAFCDGLVKTSADGGIVAFRAKFSGVATHELVIEMKTWAQSQPCGSGAELSEANGTFSIDAGFHSRDPNINYACKITGTIGTAPSMTCSGLIDI